MFRTSRGHLWAFADEDLMRRADRGDARAFGVIFDRHGGAAFCADDAAAYAVGALESGEANEFRRHLAWCGSCREELAAFQRLADALPMAVPQYAPPPGLRRRVLRAVQPEPRPRAGRPARAYWRRGS